jgi:hypothetical protein
MNVEGQRLCFGNQSSEDETDMMDSQKVVTPVETGVQTFSN